MFVITVSQPRLALHMICMDRAGVTRAAMLFGLNELLFLSRLQVNGMARTSVTWHESAMCRKRKHAARGRHVVGGMLRKDCGFWRAKLRRQIRWPAGSR